MNLDDVKQIASAIRAEVAKGVVGQSDTCDLMLTAIFARGHILLEGPPGTAKTLLAQCFSKSISMAFGRIQFTPDLMPGDVLGTNLFNFQTSQFTLTKGPIFSDILLADEINRTPPKTQAALLEAMQERKVTIDGEAYQLNPNFFVVATQNPIEQQGTYPLPEAQLDRFLFKHNLDYPSREEELLIVERHGNQTGMVSPETLGVSSAVTAEQLSEAMGTVSQLRLQEDVAAYIVDLVRATRETPAIETGASPRAAAALAAASKARAALEGREFVIPDDVKALFLPTMRHRIVLSPASEIEGKSGDQVLTTLIEQVAAPR